MSLKKLLFQFYIENVKFILEQVSSLLFEEAITANRIEKLNKTCSFERVTNFA